MAPRLVNIDRNTPMLFPVDMREWLPDDHMVHFIIDAVDHLDLRNFKINWKGSGNKQYSPSMMLMLLIYCYATGRFSSRVIESATYSDLAVRYICGGDQHPDHDTICSFRRNNKALFSECFVKVLALAKELGCLKKVGGISIDGTKIKANASKHAAVSYKRAGEMIEQLESEVAELIKKAEDADSVQLEDGLTVPGEIARRENRKKQLTEARKIIEERFREKEKADYEAKLEKRKKKGITHTPGPKPPGSKKINDKMQYNFTDPESRIMIAGNKKHFEQAYNAQGAVDTEGSYLILGRRVTNNPTDKKELIPSFETVPKHIRTVSDVSADTGYYGGDAVVEIESENNLTAYVAVEKKSHHKTVQDLEQHTEPPELEEDASITEKMRRRLKTKKGKERYKLRKQTVEPVFGTIKETIGFRHFHLRGMEKANLEWDIVTLAYNLKRLFNMTGGTLLSGNGVLKAVNI
jgi:transposase